jgi:hypothetical protein
MILLGNEFAMSIFLELLQDEFFGFLDLLNSFFDGKTFWPVTEISNSLIFMAKLSLINIHLHILSWQEWF